MRAFFIGLVFLIVALLLTGVGFLLSPLIILLGFFLRVIFACLFLIFAIWLLRKFIIFIRPRPESRAMNGADELLAA